jgi:hypothetical protein
MLRALGILSGILSLTLLAWKGLHFSFGPFLQSVLVTSAGLASNLSALVEPAIDRQLVGLSPSASWVPNLYPHWKYAFILMWLLFGTLARTAWWEGNKVTSVFLTLWGGLVAFVAGALAGTVALEDSTSNMAMAFWPIVGVVVFYLGYDAWFAALFGDKDGSWLANFGEGASWVLSRFALPGILVLVIGTQADKIPYIQTLANPGLALLAGLILVTALRFLWNGSMHLYRGSETRWQQFLEDGDTHTGIDILTVFGGTSLLVWLGTNGL